MYKMSKQNNMTADERYCYDCIHCEMCRWFPYSGCEFREKPKEAVEAEPVNDNCSSEPKGEIAKIKILLDREEVFKAVERITNEAIEKGLRKSTIQKSLILELGALEPAKIEYEYENYDPSGVGQTFSP